MVKHFLMPFWFISFESLIDPVRTLHGIVTYCYSYHDFGGLGKVTQPLSNYTDKRISGEMTVFKLGSFEVFTNYPQHKNDITVGP